MGLPACGLSRTEAIAKFHTFHAHTMPLVYTTPKHPHPYQGTIRRRQHGEKAFEERPGAEGAGAVGTFYRKKCGKGERMGAWRGGWDGSTRPKSTMYQERKRKGVKTNRILSRTSFLTRPIIKFLCRFYQGRAYSAHCSSFPSTSHTPTSSPSPQLSYNNPSHPPPLPQFTLSPSSHHHHQCYSSLPSWPSGTSSSPPESTHHSPTSHCSSVCNTASCGP